MKILAIETSCDETAVAILEVKRNVFILLSNVVSSSVNTHAKYGGIVPEIAARMQMEMMMPVIDQAVTEAGQNVSLKNIDAVAVTYGPGLVTSLVVGVETAKTLAWVLNKPLVPVNHLVAHLLVNHLQNEKINYPTLGLVVSGGHTMLVLAKNESTYKIIGQTQDDAVGEAFDKVAKILDLGYPGGPIISKKAQDGDATRFDFPRPMIHHQNFNFSFSGLKTAVLYQTKKMTKSEIKKETNNICASFQQACVDVLVSKTLRTIKKHKPKSFMLGGGVSANPVLRQTLQQKINQQFPEIKIFMPELKFTGDNAAMIAVAGYFKITNNQSRQGSLSGQLTTNNQLFRIKADPNLSF